MSVCTRSGRWRRLAWLLAATAPACAGPSYDYSRYLAHMPHSILVLPPLDETPDVNASYGYLATVTEPLAERGYYVFPVAVVDRMMRDNGLPTPGEMHQVSLAKLHEIFGCDAVLYLNVKRWGASFQLLDSVTAVQVEGRLVDARTGTVLWTGNKEAAEKSGNSSGGGFGGMLIAAVANQIQGAFADRSPEVARETNELLFEGTGDGLLVGPYHPDFASDQAARRAALAPR